MKWVMTEILQNPKTLAKARAKPEQTSTKENKLKNETSLDYHIYKPLSKKPLGPRFQAYSIWCWTKNMSWIAFGYEDAALDVEFTYRVDLIHCLSTIPKPLIEWTL
ncbi:hypothetical protein ACSBR1_038578 [Camellia fascicularis]